MKKQLFILYVLLLLILSHTAWAQDWTVPVNVSNTNDMILFSDFTIDNNGIIHCVWNLKYNSNYGVIFYSYSEDDGNSWFEPISISQNVSNYCTSPYIIHDSQNNLYVGYDLNNYDPPPNWGSWSCLAIKDSSGWGQPFTISEGISTRLAVDNNDRVYVFWFMGAPHNGEFYYQYLEDEIWSGVFCPYDNDELTGINEIAVDENNSLHCAGYHDSTGFLDVHPAYLRYEYESNQWGNLMDFTEKESISDIDIVLDTNWLPHICWGGDALYYSFYDGNQWAGTDTINLTDPSKVVIETDSCNKLHIAATEKPGDSMKLYYYHNNDGVNWEKILVDQSGNVIFTPEFEISNNVLYLTYKRSDEPTSGDVFITKLDLLTVVFSPKIKPIISNRLDQNRPNPFSNRTRIGYFLNRPGYTKLFIKNLNGRPVKILFEGRQDRGNHIVQWDGTDDHGHEAPSGIYFYVLSSDNQTITKRLLFIP